MLHLVGQSSRFKATAAAVANFIRDNVICRFGVPKYIISHNGTSFVNSHVRQLFENMTLIILSPAPTLKGVVKPRPLTRPYPESLTGVSTRNLRDAQISYPLCYGHIVPRSALPRRSHLP